jgi:hypothetical protein
MMEEALKRAKAIVSKWPKWKQNILQDSEKPCAQVPRVPVVIDWESAMNEERQRILNWLENDAVEYEMQGKPNKAKTLRDFKRHLVGTEFWDLS